MSKGMQNALIAFLVVMVFGVALWTIAEPYFTRQDQLVAPITVSVNGERLSLARVPYKRGSAVMVPLREVFEAAGLAVGYNPGTGQILAGDLILHPESDRAVLDGRTITLDRPVEIIDGRAFVPAALLEHTHRVEVTYNPGERHLAVETLQEQVQR